MIRILVIFISLCFFGAAHAQEKDQIAAPPSDTVFEFVDVYPQFPGGKDSMARFLSRNLRYLPGCEEYTVTIYIEMIVARDGKISNVRVVKGANEALNTEAIRVVKSMPNWIPGQHNGKPIAVKFKIPVRFELK